MKRSHCRLGDSLIFVKHLSIALNEAGQLGFIPFCGGGALQYDVIADTGNPQLLLHFKTVLGSVRKL